MSEKRLAFMVPIQFGAKPNEDGTRAFGGIAYSGEVITDHPMFDAVVFDLSTTKFKTPAPLLFEHRDPIGKIDVANIDSAIKIEGVIFSDVEGASSKVTAMADRGMPWQMSVGIWPGQVDHVKAGASVEVNGRKLDGPLAVFRQNRIRETSICALGADGGTSAEVFTIGGNAPRQSTGANEMDQAKHDEIVGELNTKIADLTKANAELAAQVTEANKKIALSLEAARASALTALGKELAREFTADEWKDYQAMTDATFEFVAAQMRAAKTKTDPKLFEAHATSVSASPQAGAGSDDVEAIRKAAREYIAEQAKAGVEVSISDAVTFVTRRPE